MLPLPYAPCGRYDSTSATLRDSSSVSRTNCVGIEWVISLLPLPAVHVSGTVKLAMLQQCVLYKQRGAVQQCSQQAHRQCHVVEEGQGAHKGNSQHNPLHRSGGAKVGHICRQEWTITDWVCSHLQLGYQGKCWTGGVHETLPAQPSTSSLP